MKTLTLIAFIYLCISWYTKLKRYYKQKNEKYHDDFIEIVFDSLDYILFILYNILFLIGLIYCILRYLP